MATTAVVPSGMSRLGRLHMNHISDDEEDPGLLCGISYPGKHGKQMEGYYHWLASWLRFLKVAVYFISFA